VPGSDSCPTFPEGEGAGHPSNRGKRFPPHPLTAAEAAKLLDVCGRGRRGAQDRALLVLGYRAGLRCSEALGLDLDDVRRVSGGIVVRVRQPKGYARGAQPREVGLDPKAAGLLEEHLALRGTAAGPVFLTSRGHRVRANHVRRRIAWLGQAAGIERRVHFHALRHTFARELYDEGVGLLEIRYALGHASLRQTQGYLASIGATEVIAITTGREW
jgi:integrase